MPRIHINPKISVSVVFVSAMFMSIMDTTIVNVALPSIGRQFGVSTAALDSVVVGYLVSLAIFIPTAGWLGDRFGPKRVLLISVAVFTLASVLCGLATSMPQLVAFRFLQGSGGGMMVPVGMALLFRTFPPAERVRAASLLMIPTTLAPAMGPVIGGLLVTYLSWRWVFLVNLPIGVVVLTFGLVFLDPHREASPGRFDLAGFIFSGVGFAALMFGLSEGPNLGWTSPGVLGGLLVGIALLALLVPTELRSPEPLLELRLFTNRLFRLASLIAQIAVGAFLGFLFVVPLFLQEGLGLNALQSGLSTFPEALGALAGSQFASRLLYARVGPRRLLCGSLALMAVFLVLMTQISSTEQLWWMRSLMFCIGLCIGPVFISTQASAFTQISHAHTSHASSLYNSQRQMGSAMGVAVMAMVLNAVGTIKLVGGVPEANLAAYHAAFVVAGAVALVASAVSLGIHDGDAAATMIRKPART